jgi:hypothetical protein
MQIDGIDLDNIGAMSMAPCQRTAPEDDWVCARDNGYIPASLYGLYQRAQFLSFGAAPRFLSDPDNILFSYSGLVLRSVQQSLVEARDAQRDFIAANGLVFDRMKEATGQPWERGADKRARKNFRDMLIALSTALDSLADLIAIFLPGGIKGLEVGRSQFSRVEKWLEKPLAPLGLIVTPSEHHLNRLHSALDVLINAPLPEKDWLPLMRLLRNKSAHLGQPLFRQVALQAPDGTFFTFIPREWPYLWEQMMKPIGAATTAQPFPELMRGSLIHQDIESYSAGLIAKVLAVVDAACAVLNDVYEQFRDMPENQAALAQLRSNFEKYEFLSFVGG